MCLETENVHFKRFKNLEDFENFENASDPHEIEIQEKETYKLTNDNIHLLHLNYI